MTTSYWDSGYNQASLERTDVVRQQFTESTLKQVFDISRVGVFTDL
jgi:hypothetical protein